MPALNNTYLDNVLVSMVYLDSMENRHDLMNLDDMEKVATIDARAIMNCSIDNAMKFEKEVKFVDSERTYLWYMEKELVGAYVMYEVDWMDLFVKESDGMHIRTRLIDYFHLKKKFKDAANDRGLTFSVISVQTLMKEVMEVE